MGQRMQPRSSANLLLCRMATEVGQQLFLHDAGFLDAPRSEHQPWYLAGVVDVEYHDLKQKGLLRVVHYDTTEPVEPGFTGALEFGGMTDPDETLPSPGHMIRLNLALDLPYLPGLQEGMYAWEIRFGDLRHLVPFRVLDQDEDKDKDKDERVDDEPPTGRISDGDI